MVVLPAWALAVVLLTAQDTYLAATYGFSEGAGTTTADFSGNANTGSLLNGAGWTSAGRFGNALSLDGVNDAVEMPWSNSLNLTSAFTLEGWIYPTASATHTIVRKGTGTTYALLVESDGTPHFWGVFDGVFRSVRGQTPVRYSGWTHLAATYDGTMLRLYANAVEQASLAVTGSVPVADSQGVLTPLYIGGGPGSSETVLGILDEVRIYRRGLTAGEVALDIATPVDSSTPFQVSVASPPSDARGVLTTPIAATFSRPIDASTLTGATFELRDSNGSAVGASVAYSATSRKATLTPASPLTALSNYTVRVVGGGSGIRDTGGATLAADVQWTFTTAASATEPSAAFALGDATGTQAFDTSGNDNHGTLLHGPQWEAGYFGNGLAFDGLDDTVRVPMSDTLTLGAAFTIEGWVHPTASRTHTIVRHGTGDYALQLEPDATPRVWGYFGGVLRQVQGTTAVPYATWSHIAATYDGTTLRLYVNAVEQGSLAVTGLLPASVVPLYLGGGPAAGETLAGTLDEIRIYRRALTVEEITADMNEAVDGVAPTVISTVPAAGATGVHPTADIVVTFSEPMAPSSITSASVELRDASNTAVAATVTYTDATRTATLNPGANLPGPVTYTAYVYGGSSAAPVTDRAGNRLAATYSWSFVTADVTPPTVVAVSPVAGARNVALTTPLQITFSEPVDPATINTNTIQLRDTRNVVVGGTVTYTAPAQVATFTPSAALLPTRTYTATVVGGASGERVKDLAGNAMPANHVWTFITTVERSRMAAGTTHSAIVDDTGQVWTWGSNTFGERGTQLDGRLPGSVTGAAGILSVAAGYGHTLALKTDGTVLSWGYNVEGQLGIGNQVNQSTPVAVSGLSDVIAIAAGRTHSVALKSDGTVWTWGSGWQIGDGQSVRKLTPVQVTALSDVIAVAAGESHTLALKGDGTIRTWGSNILGQLGDGTTTARLSPVQVSSLTGVVAIGAGNNHSLAIVGSDLSGRAWGAASSGQLGDGGSYVWTGTPTTVAGLTNIRSVEGGGTHSLAALLDGSLRNWGANATVTGASSSTPVNVPGAPVGWQVAGGDSHSLAVTEDGVVSAWMLNAAGQLGDGTVVERRTAVQISEAGYNWKVGTPNFSVPGGTYTAVQNVTVSSATAATTIRYTLNGVDPTEADSGVPANGVVSIAESQTLKAKAWKTGQPASNVHGATYTLQAPAPVLSPGSGTYFTSQVVTVTNAVSGVTMHYTTNGATPTTSDPQVASGGTIPIYVSTTLKVKGWKTGWTESAVTTGTYTLKVSTPTFTPDGGSYAGPVTVTIATATSGAIVRYTVDGAEPGLTSPQYTGAITVSGSTTVRATAWKDGWTTSDTKVANYFVSNGTASAPSFDPTPGTYTAPIVVRISSPDPDAVIRYTTDGTEPTARSQRYTWPLLVASTTTFKAKAFRRDYAASSTTTATYALDASGAVATPTLQPAGGWFSTAQTVTVTVATLDATLHYSTNGIDPTQADPTVASGGTITVPRPMPLKVRAFKAGLNASAVRRGDYAITGAVAAGGQSSYAIKSDGTLWAWGWNTSGQIGDGTTQTRTAPVIISGVADVVSIVGGGDHALAMKRDGTVWAWGANFYGQLGLSDQTTRYVPIQIPTLSNVVAVAAGLRHSLALKADGTVWAWGSNFYGELGDGTLVRKLAPVQVPALSGVKRIAAGGEFSLAIKDDGTEAGLLWTWGRNDRGQLGDGTRTDRLVPTRAAIANVAAVGAGNYTTYAIAADGALWTWGGNANGQVGDGTWGGTTMDRLLPVQLVALGTGISAAGGTTHGGALTADGFVWAWGYNDFRQLGDGTGISRNYPARVSTLSSVLLTSFGWSHAVAAKADASVWAWGGNGTGAIGDGTTTTKLVPVLSSGLTLGDNAWLTADHDSDGLATWMELRLGSDPLAFDSNGNGIGDAADEALELEAGNADLDRDGLSNAAEMAQGTDPFNADTDGDGVPDNADAFALDPSRSQPPSPTPGDTTPPVITVTEPTNAVPIP